jgi:hypothetical protein
MYGKTTVTKLSGCDATKRQEIEMGAVAQKKLQLNHSKLLFSLDYDVVGLSVRVHCPQKVQGG